MPVGIDDMAIYVPKLYIDSKDFAIARGIDPHKLEIGIGIYKMAMVDTNQDPACMAANACLKLMQKNDLKPQDIGRMYVATESALDESKAMNSFVIGMLEQIYGDGSFEHAGGIECKFACVSGSYALYDNANWIRVKENTRLVAFDPKVTSTIIKNEYDFYRPLGRETPLVNGSYSNYLYLIQVKKAFDSYREKAIKNRLIQLKEEESITDKIDYISVHLPYRKMGEKALAYLLRHEWRYLPRWKQIIEEVGMNEPT